MCECHWFLLLRNTYTLLPDEGRNNTEAAWANREMKLFQKVRPEEGKEFSLTEVKSVLRIYFHH